MLVNVAHRGNSARMQVFKRFARMDAAPQDGVLRMSASSDAPVSWGDWSEVLAHESDSVDSSAARALLINHDPNRIAGTIESFGTNGRTSEASAKLMDGAKMESGVSVSDAVASGALRGISVAYSYDRANTVWNSEKRTLTVKKWRLLEISLTPIPADPSAAVRSFPFEKEVPMTEPSHGAQPDAALATAAREAAIKEAREVVTFARSFGIDADAVIGKSMTEVKDMALDHARAQLAKNASTPAHQVTEVTADAGDKMRAAAVSALYRKAPFMKPEGEDAELLKRFGNHSVSLRYLLHDIAKADGFQVRNELDLASYAQGVIDLRTHGRRDAPNKVTAQFSNILANVANKAVLAGLNSYNQATWNIWCTQRNVSDFKAVSNVGLSSGLLIKTAEGLAFPELNQADGGYNSQLGLYGATVSLSFQALVNDDMGAFMNELRRVGLIAGETIDRRVYTVLLGATWTNDTSTGSTLGTPANLDKPRSALRSKLNPAGVKMGTVARYLLHDTANAVNAQVATGAIYGPGQTTAPSLGSRSIVPVESHWIGDTSILGGALTTDYYVTGDGGMVDTVLVNFLEGLGMSPMIQPYDAGASASEKWKIMVPFEATIATHTDSAGTARVTGIQKATVA
jgi:phage head maturation protease